MEEALKVAEEDLQHEERVARMPGMIPILESIHCAPYPAYKEIQRVQQQWHCVQELDSTPAAANATGGARF